MRLQGSRIRPLGRVRTPLCARAAPEPGDAFPVPPAPVGPPRECCLWGGGPRFAWTRLRVHLCDEWGEWMGATPAAEGSAVAARAHREGMPISRAPLFLSHVLSSPPPTHSPRRSTASQAPAQVSAAAVSVCDVMVLILSFRVSARPPPAAIPRQTGGAPAREDVGVTDRGGVVDILISKNKKP